MRQFKIFLLCKMSLDNVMISKILVFQIFSTLTSGVFSTELLPERYLKPQNFNHHPFTDVGIPASLKKALKLSNPYAVLSNKRPREGREFPPQNVIIYPTPHSSVVARKFLETNEINKHKDPYINVPKNYAFSYIVKDQHSGDDFSHSQAHNGKATRGQYRVKLPDGRTQIVSYTADHKGYRADVQYEEELISESLTKSGFHSVQPAPEASTEIPDISTNNHVSYKADYLTDQNSSLKPFPQVVYTVTASPSSPSSTASPGQYVAENTRLNVVVNSKLAPDYQPHYVTTTAVPYAQHQLVSTTAAPHYVSQQHVSSVPLHAANTVSPAYHLDQYQNYQTILSTVSPDGAVLVTPRSTYNRAISKSEQTASLYYRLL